MLDRIADELFENPDGLLARTCNNILSRKNIYTLRLKSNPSPLE